MKQPTKQQEKIENFLLEIRKFSQKTTYIVGPLNLNA